jgi:hypothetical protein
MPTNPEIRTCCKCGATIGVVAEIEYENTQVEALKAGGLYIFDLNAVCAKCGEPYHHHIGTRQLVKLLRMTGRITTEEELNRPIKA